MRPTLELERGRAGSAGRSVNKDSFHLIGKDEAAEIERKRQERGAREGRRDNGAEIKRRDSVANTRVHYMYTYISIVVCVRIPTLERSIMAAVLLQASAKFRYVRRRCRSYYQREREARWRI